MKKLNTSLLNKGIFAIAIVAVTGTVGAVHFAQAAPTTGSSSGYGTTGEQAAAAADAFQASLNTCNVNFDNEVASLANTAKGQLASGVPVSNFGSLFTGASTTYDNAVTQAFNTFRSQVTQSANTATSKDQFIDEFNNAKATYLNALDAAKNQLAASLSNLGNNANVVKDQFMNGFNSQRDAYSNCLEQGKNTFANTVSNL